MAIGDESCEQIPGWQYSGANDNAAGVGVLLEIARLWHESGYRPKRTVVFAAWAAQEAGEVGSTLYVEHPAMPLENTVATIQLDGLAGGGGFYLVAQGQREDEGEMIFTMEIANQLLDGRLILPRESARSDQIPFQEAGVPSMLVGWRYASDDNWPDGIADEIEAMRVDIAGRLVTLTLMAMAR
jgi:Zn-dependent M28 family amino/carboxypeptidase